LVSTTETKQHTDTEGLTRAETDMEDTAHHHRYEIRPGLANESGQRQALELRQLQGELKIEQTTEIQR